MVRLALIVAALATPVSGQTLGVDPALVYACEAATPVGVTQPVCLGSAARACQGQPGGATTFGMSECIQRETAAWDVLLNEEYKTTRAQFREQVGLAEALLTARRTWIAYSDAEHELRDMRVASP